MAKKIILLLAVMIFAASAEAAANDINFDPLATSYAEGDPASLTLIRMKDNGVIYFVATDTAANIMAFVQYSRELYDFYATRGEYGYSPLIFEMALPMRERGQIDDDLGAWQGTVHVLPVYALFDVRDGQIICDKPFYSASGLNPSHYHGTIRNPQHERLIEIFLTHMPRLHEHAAAKGLNLP